MADKRPSSPNPVTHHHSGENLLPPPEPAYLRESVEERRRSSATTVSDHPSSEDEREATELHAIRPECSRILSPGTPLRHWYDPIKRFWRHEVRISVPHVDCRDHLANERTFLGYLRTSTVLSMIGIFIAQFYRLQHAPNPHKTFGFYAVSKPLSLIFQAAALITVVLGGLRFWRQQSAMARGKVHAGGFEIVGLGIGFLLLLLMLFCVHIALDVKTESRPWIIQ